MVKKIIILAIALIITAILLIGSLSFDYFKTGQVVKGDKNVLKIGAFLPLTGDFSYIGQEIRKGMDLAKNEEKNMDINIIYEDDQFSNTQSVTAANKLLNFDKIDVGLTSFVEEAKSTSTLFDNKKVPLLVVWDSNNDIKNSGDYIYSTGFSTELAGEKMADYSYNNLRLRKIVIVSHTDQWSEIISNSFRNKFEKLGGKVEIWDKYNVEEIDYRQSIIKIKESDVDGVYFPLLYPGNSLFLIQAKQLGLNKTQLSGDALFQDSINAAGPASDGVYYTNYYTDNSEELRLKYINTYGSEPSDIDLVSFGYYGVKTIVKAYENNPNNLKIGLDKSIGPTRTLDKVEKIYLVNRGKPLLLE